MDRKRFEQLVADALDSLPQEFQECLDNIEVVVEYRPTSEQLNKAELEPRSTLLGLYEGVPLTERGAHYGLVLPDKISIFQRPIEETCYNDDGIMAQIRAVVQHEIAHHFGIDDRRLDELGR
jgi:predicted Zn-dependent protease with MMP-like domain